MKLALRCLVLLVGLVSVATACGCRSPRCVPARPMSVVDYPAATGIEHAQLNEAWSSADATLSIQQASLVTGGVWVVLTLSTKGGEAQAVEMMEKVQDGLGSGLDVLGSEILTVVNAQGRLVEIEGARKICRDYFANPNGFMIPGATSPLFTDEQLREPVVVRRGEAGWTHVQTRIGFAYRSGKRETPVQALLTPDFDWAGFFGVTSVHVDADALPVVPWPE